MASLVPRPPYSDEELKKFYPKQLRLVQVQIFLRHGERAPIKARFQNAGLSPSRRFKAEVMANTNGSEWDQLRFRRLMETFGPNDLPVMAQGPNNAISDICQLGELTDKGRSTTLALGERLRELYVNRLGFLPSTLTSPSFIYLRATPIVRALESVQQSFYGLYPSSTRSNLESHPVIYARSLEDETLYDNAKNCRRMAQWAHAFEKRAKERWSDTDELRYVNKVIGKWMPESSPEIKLDSHPRLSGIMDTVNATLAHGSATRLPKEFYDEKLLKTFNNVVFDAWFSGYKDSQEYRRLGWGSLLGDVVSRMMSVVNYQSLGSGASWKQDEQGPARFAMSGSHDTTIAGILTSLGANEEDMWPPFTSHIAIELFQQKDSDGNVSGGPSSNIKSNSQHVKPSGQSWLSSLWPFKGSSLVPASADRKPIQDLSSAERENLKRYYVRIRYNDRPMTIPGCRFAGRHLDSDGVKDESFCTLEAFKAIVDAFTPQDWRSECISNMDKPPKIPRNEDEKEPAGYIPGDLPAIRDA